MIVKIETYHDSEFWCARGISHDIFTQGKTYDDLLRGIKEAVELHFEDEIKKGKTIEILVMSEMEVGSVTEAAAG